MLAVAVCQKTADNPSKAELTASANCDNLPLHPVIVMLEERS
jgi:hypothetical protein